MVFNSLSFLVFFPVVTALYFLLPHRYRWMMLLAAIVAVLSSIIGLYVSFYLGISSGSAVVLTCTFFFVVTWIVQSLRGKRASR